MDLLVKVAFDDSTALLLTYNSEENIQEFFDTFVKSLENVLEFKYQNCSDSERIMTYSLDGQVYFITSINTFKTAVTLHMEKKILNITVSKNYPSNCSQPSPSPAKAS